MPTTPPPTTPGHEEGVAAYDWSDPDAYRPPAPARSGTTGHGEFGDHAFWERLPFRGVPWIRVLVVGVVCFALWFVLDAPSLQH